jgi:pimeloyl-ACP methyl ester carboxylesterase
MAVTANRTAGDTTLRPFTIDFPDSDLEDLRARVAATRWPDREPVDDFSQGVQLATTQALARYWATDYDWRPCEARLNAVPNFMTEIDGLDIHFIHVRSKHEDALPLLVNHGWPGSVIEQLKIIDLLTDPTAHGASAADAFHLVIPSMPGYGFSARPAEVGWGAVRTGRAWVTLMKRLGYSQFVAAGGDWGAIIVDVMAGGRDAPAPPEPAPPELLGIHTNFAGVFPPEIDMALQTGGALPSDLSADERRAADQLAILYPYAPGIIMGLRPQTLLGIADSPVGLAAFLLDHDVKSYELISRVFLDGAREGLTRDDILDNVTMFWLTKTAISSSRLYWEWLSREKGSFVAVKNVSVPVAVSVFPDEIFQAPRSWAEQAYPNLIHFNEVDRGGHFAAWEQPELYASEIRAGFRSLR